MQKKMHTELMIHFRRLLLERAIAVLNPEQKWRKTMDRILDHDIDPYSAAGELVEQIVEKSVICRLFGGLVPITVLYAFNSASDTSPTSPQMASADR